MAKKWVKTTALWLLILGGLVWGTVGLFEWNFLQALLVRMSWLLRAVYVAVGAIAVYAAWNAVKGRA